MASSVAQQYYDGTELEVAQTTIQLASVYGELMKKLKDENAVLDKDQVSLYNLGLDENKQERNEIETQLAQEKILSRISLKVLGSSGIHLYLILYTHIASTLFKKAGRVATLKLLKLFLNSMARKLPGGLPSLATIAENTILHIAEDNSTAFTEQVSTYLTANSKTYVKELGVMVPVEEVPVAKAIAVQIASTYPFQADRQLSTDPIASGHAINEKGAQEYQRERLLALREETKKIIKEEGDNIHLPDSDKTVKEWWTENIDEKGDMAVSQFFEQISENTIGSVDALSQQVISAMEESISSGAEDFTGRLLLNTLFTSGKQEALPMMQCFSLLNSEMISYLKENLPVRFQSLTANEYNNMDPYQFMRMGTEEERQMFKLWMDWLNQSRSYAFIAEQWNSAEVGFAAGVLRPVESGVGPSSEHITNSINNLERKFVEQDAKFANMTLAEYSNYSTFAGFDADEIAGNTAGRQLKTMARDLIANVPAFVKRQSAKLEDAIAKEDLQGELYSAFKQAFSKFFKSSMRQSETEIVTVFVNFIPDEFRSMSALARSMKPSLENNARLGREEIGRLLKTNSLPAINNGTLQERETNFTYDYESFDSIAQESLDAMQRTLNISINDPKEIWKLYLRRDEVTITLDSGEETTEAIVTLLRDDGVNKSIDVYQEAEFLRNPNLSSELKKQYWEGIHQHNDLMERIRKSETVQGIKIEKQGSLIKEGLVENAPFEAQVMSQTALRMRAARISAEGVIPYVSSGLSRVGNHFMNSAFTKILGSATKEIFENISGGPFGVALMYADFIFRSYGRSKFESIIERKKRAKQYGYYALLLPVLSPMQYMAYMYGNNLPANIQADSRIITGLPDINAIFYKKMPWLADRSNEGITDKVEEDFLGRYGNIATMFGLDHEPQDHDDLGSMVEFAKEAAELQGKGSINPYSYFKEELFGSESSKKSSMLLLRSFFHLLVPIHSKQISDWEALCPVKIPGIRLGYGTNQVLGAAEYVPPIAYQITHQDGEIPTTKPSEMIKYGPQDPENLPYDYYSYVKEHIEKNMSNVGSSSEVFSPSVKYELKTLTWDEGKIEKWPHYTVKCHDAYKGFNNGHGAIRDLTFPRDQLPLVPLPALASERQNYWNEMVNKFGMSDENYIKTALNYIPDLWYITPNKSKAFCYDPETNTEWGIIVEDAIINGDTVTLPEGSFWFRDAARMNSVYGQKCTLNKFHFYFTPETPDGFWSINTVAAELTSGGMLLFDLLFDTIWAIIVSAVDEGVSNGLNFLDGMEKTAQDQVKDDWKHFAYLWRRKDKQSSLQTNTIELDIPVFPKKGEPLPNVADMEHSSVVVNCDPWFCYTNSPPAFVRNMKNWKMDSPYGTTKFDASNFVNNACKRKKTKKRGDINACTWDPTMGDNDGYETVSFSDEERSLIHKIKESLFESGQKETDLVNQIKPDIPEAVPFNQKGAEEYCEKLQAYQNAVKNRFSNYDVSSDNAIRKFTRTSVETANQLQTIYRTFDEKINECNATISTNNSSSPSSNQNSNPNLVHMTGVDITLAEHLAILAGNKETSDVVLRLIQTQIPSAFDFVNVPETEQDPEYCKDLKKFYSDVQKHFNAWASLKGNTINQLRDKGYSVDEVGGAQNLNAFYQAIENELIDCPDSDDETEDESNNSKKEDDSDSLLDSDKDKTKDFFRLFTNAEAESSQSTSNVGSSGTQSATHANPTNSSTQVNLQSMNAGNVQAPPRNHPPNLISEALRSQNEQNSPAGVPQNSSALANAVNAPLSFDQFIVNRLGRNPVASKSINKQTVAEPITAPPVNLSAQPAKKESKEKKPIVINVTNDNSGIYLAIGGILLLIFFALNK